MAHEICIQSETTVYGRALLESVEPDDLQNAWPLVVPGVRICHKNSVAHWLPEDVYSAVRTGHSNLHLAYIDGEYAGFTLTTPSRTWDGPVLHLWCAYNAGKHDVLSIFHDDLIGMARKIGARRISFWSPRAGWEKLAPRYGFKPMQVEYVKEL